MAVCGYCRAKPRGQVQSVDEQKRAIRLYCRQSGLLPEHPSDVGPPVRAEPYWFVDPPASGKLPLLQREAGRVLCRDIKSGDHVIIHTLDRAFRKMGDFVQILSEFTHRGIHLHVTDLGGRAVALSRWEPHGLVKLLTIFVALEKAGRAERASATSRDRRDRGGGLGPPRLGFKHVSMVRTQNGRRRRLLKQVEDPSEREIMRKILGWRQQRPPWSWHQIAAMLANDGVKTRDGRRWDASRCRRAARAAAVLQLLAAHGVQDPFPVLGRLADRAAADEGPG
jgi:DNA invertase Pin-like site-specific DNA recombinase